MVSFWEGAAGAFAVGFPPLRESVLFWGFASLVVHVCQRLVEHTAYSVDPSSRRISGSHAALCIGSIVWALDVVGLFMYAEIAHHALELVPALSGLLIMAVSARLTIPTLSASTSKRRIVLAGAWLAAGMLVAHFTVTQSHVHSFAQVNWPAIALSAIAAVGLASYTSVRHRSAKLSVLTPHYRQQTWHDKALCGGVILVLHWLLMNTFALRTGEAVGGANGMALLVVLLVFAVAVAAEQLSNMRSDAGRQQLLRRGLSLMRASGVPLDAARDIELSLIADHLPSLLRRERLALHFQPIVDLQQPGVQFEVLLRIHDSTLGGVHPETFLLVCELQGRTAEVDRMILRNALDCVENWQVQGLRDIAISVNVAPVTLLERDFAPWLRDELAARAVPPTALKLEMTEHAIIAQGAQMVAAIDDLAALGVAVLMDDFGAGYSSLGMLAELPIAGIKCDRLFVRQLPHDGRRQRLLQHLGAMAHELGLSVVVEGVETLGELQALHTLGLHCIQGYVFSKPIAAADVAAWHRTQMPAQRAALQAALAAGQHTAPWAVQPRPPVPCAPSA